jgi:hypothetical protein
MAPPHRRTHNTNFRMRFQCLAIRSYALANPHTMYIPRQNRPIPPALGGSYLRFPSAISSVRGVYTQNGHTVVNTQSAPHQNTWLNLHREGMPPSTGMRPRRRTLRQDLASGGCPGCSAGQWDLPRHGQPTTQRRGHCWQSGTARPRASPWWRWPGSRGGPDGRCWEPRGCRRGALRRGGPSETQQYNEIRRYTVHSTSTRHGATVKYDAINSWRCA